MAESEYRTFRTRCDCEILLHSKNLNRLHLESLALTELNTIHCSCSNDILLCRYLNNVLYTVTEPRMHIFIEQKGPGGTEKTILYKTQSQRFKVALSDIPKPAIDGSQLNWFSRDQLRFDLSMGRLVLLKLILSFHPWQMKRKMYDQWLALVSKNNPCTSIT